MLILGSHLLPKFKNVIFKMESDIKKFTFSSIHSNFLNFLQINIKYVKNICIIEHF